MSSKQIFREDILWHQLVILMMSFYLLVDMLTGFTVIYLGVDLKVSLIYKMPILFLLLFLIGRYNIKIMLLLISAILFFFIGPFYQFTQHVRLDFFAVDFALLIKAIMPLTVFIYFSILIRIDDIFANKAITRILWISFAILCLNFALGAAGIGKSTYQLTDDEVAGSTGLIMAGNELGAAFLVTFGWALHNVWNKHGHFLYLCLCTLTVLSGIVVATKTTMLASILLVFFVPIVNERNHLLSITMLKVKILLPLIIFTSIVVYLVFDLLKSIGLYDRIMWFYQQRGLLGIILSGRDTMVLERMDIVINNSSLFEQIFGQGHAISLKDKRGDALTEVDSVDISNFFGVFLLSALTVFYLWIIKQAYNLTVKTQSYSGPFILIVSFLLFLLSQLSGHIWYSGTLGILLGVMCSCIYIKHTGKAHT